MAQNNSTRTETREVYRIPTNFTEGTGLFGGIISLRHFIEACVMALPVFFLALKIPIKDLQIRIAVVGFLTMIPFMIGAFGFNGDSISEFLAYFFQYRKKRRIMRYNPRVKLEFTGEIPMHKEVPADKLRKMIDNLGQNDNNGTTESDRYFAIDGSIAFEDDVELEKKLKAKEEYLRRGHTNGKPNKKPKRR